MLPEVSQSAQTQTHTHARTHNHLTDRPVLEEIFTHSHPSCSSDILYQLPLPTTIYSILLVQFTCLTVLFHKLSPGVLWSSTWSGALYLILHALLSTNQQYSDNVIMHALF